MTEVSTQTAQTVFDSVENFSIKHPLKHVWTLWFTKPPSGQKGEDWRDLLKSIISFNTVEEFWGVYNNIEKVSDLPMKADYHLFRKGVKPEWEDKQNSKGGKWAYQFKEKRSVFIDEIWLHSMLSVIGETLEDGGDDEIMGVVVNIRRGFYRVGLWTRSCSNTDVLMKIGERFKTVLQLPNAERLDFNSHSDSAHSGSSRAKAKMVI